MPDGGKPSGWQLLRLDELGTVERGRSRHRPRNDPALYGGPYPFVQTGDIKAAGLRLFSYTQTYSETGLAQSRMWPAGTLCITIAANICDTAILGIPVCFPDSIVGFTPKPGVADAVFVKYALDHAKQRFADISRGATQDNLSLEKMLSQRLPVPPLATQRRIASILGAYDDLIEVNRRRIALLEEMARRLFEEWFVHFSFPGHDGTESGADAEAPIDWHRGTVDDGLRFIRGRSYRSAELSDTLGLPFVNLKCLKRDGGFRRDGLKHFTGKYKAEQALRPGDVVMAVTDMTQERRIVGQAALIPRLDEPLAVLSMDLVKVMPTARTRLPFLYFWLRFSGFSKVAAQHANGANVLHLSPKALVGLPMVIPPIDVQEAFCQAAEPIMAQADVLASMEDRLAASRDHLLPRLISGELSVTVAEREMEAAA